MTVACRQFDANCAFRRGKRIYPCRLFGLLANLSFCLLLSGVLVKFTAASSSQQGAAGSSQQTQSTAPQGMKQGSPSPAQQPKSRLLTRSEGRSIVSASWQHTQPVSAAQDCSHLVHEIYSAAGYEFPYATSFALYAGDPSFGRVNHPQPGDIIAWPGHVGIVVNPSRHSFFSLVSTGAQAEDYTSPYWRSRGRARFYRFLVLNSSNSPALRKVSASARIPQNPGGLTPRDNHPEAARTEDQEDVKEAPERSLAAPVIDPADSPLLTSESRRISVTSAQPVPTREEVAKSLTDWTTGTAEVLRNSEPLKFRQPVIILDRLTITRVRLKSDRGTVELQIGSSVLLNNEGIDYKQRREKMHWEMNRTDSGWVVSAPSERLYISREAAVRVFAAQLAHLTNDDSSAHDQAVLGQEARLANLLGALLQNR